MKIKFYNIEYFDVPENELKELSDPNQHISLPTDIIGLFSRLHEENIISIQYNIFITSLAGSRNDNITEKQLAKKMKISNIDYNKLLFYVLDKGLLIKVGVSGYDFAPFVRILTNYDEAKDSKDKGYLVSLVEEAIRIK